MPTRLIDLQRFLKDYHPEVTLKIVITPNNVITISGDACTITPENRELESWVSIWEVSDDTPVNIYIKNKFRTQVLLDSLERVLNHLR